MKAVFVVFLVVLACCAGAAIAEEEGVVKQQWEDFKTRFGRRFATGAEESARFEVFKDNLQRAAQLNAENPRARFGVTKFSDLRPEEFASQYLRTMPAAVKKNHPIATKATASKGERVDWRDRKHNPAGCVAVNSPRDQGQCGSCWAFSAAEAIEACEMIRRCNRSDWFAASPQQFVDCCHEDGSAGCDGGDPAACLLWATQTNISTEDAYPYEEFERKCRAVKEVAVPSGHCRFISVPAGNETALQELLLLAPVSVAIDATQLQYYEGGVIGSCKAKEINHAILLVALDDRVYTLENSWGEDWGNEGFFWMEADKDCLLITSLASLAVPITP